MDDNHAALLAAMYDDEPEQAPSGQETQPVDLMTARKTRRMVMGAVSYDIPTVEYMQMLEMRLSQQERIIIEQARHLKRLEVLISSLRNVVRRNTSAVSEVSRGLDHKLDRRDI